MASVNASLLSKLPTAAIGRTPETYSPSPNTQNSAEFMARHQRFLASVLQSPAPPAKGPTRRRHSFTKPPNSGFCGVGLVVWFLGFVVLGLRWSSRAIKSFGMSELEARKLKFSTTGTEALLMGILVEVMVELESYAFMLEVFSYISFFGLIWPDSKGMSFLIALGTSLAAKFLRASGITLTKVREEAIKLVGKADMFYFSPEHPPLTEEAQRVLDWAIDQKIKSGDGGETTTSYLLLGIWLEANSPGHKILATLGFNDEKVKQLETLLSEPGVDDD
ncbi:hypothetical protein F8388_004238 [Cannabis sativa]|uniref:Clp R domain-containing protein n=1 Tax=Cannabis sativa TaxID=3483 RepID=A0A7J6F7A5_CANSA|nr:hypothetical protein F8388_004238 [Cannabis sativa]